MNPFMAGMAILNLIAAGWYYSHGNPKLAGVTVCYAISSAILGTM